MEDEVLNHIKFVGSRLGFMDGSRIPRVGYCTVVINGKSYNTRDLTGMLLRRRRHKDLRHSESFDIARGNPTMQIDRKTAKKLGMTIFKSNWPCRNGHDSWRFISNYACVQCKGLLT